MKRLLFVLFTVLGSLAPETAYSAPARPDRPRLIVVVSIDQFPYEYLERMRANFSPEGFFLRLCDEGANFVNCQHAHAFTYTAPGHSVLLTGCFPNLNGIVGNEWFDRAKGRSVYCVDDDQYPIVGNPLPSDESPSRSKAADKKPVKKPGVSPRPLLVGTLGDVMKLGNPSSKVFGIALKDRAGVLMAGHLADGVYWFDTKTGNWVTSTYYRESLPGYLRNYNESDAAEAYINKPWNLLHERQRYLHYPAEKAVLLPKPGFPHQMGDRPGAIYYGTMTLSPYGNQLTLDTARLLLASEKLGQDEAPDLLAINLSSNDYIGHMFGPHSLEVQDITYRTDRQLAEFAAFVEEQLQGAPWVFALSSDHGVGPRPEYAAELGLPAQRSPLGSFTKLKLVLNQRLGVELGERKDKKPYVLDLDENSVYLDRSAAELGGEKFIAAQRLVRDFLLEQPRVAIAFTREQLYAQGAAARSLRGAFERAFNPQRSGDVLYALHPYNISGGSPATHGSPWVYDRHVPLIFWGDGIRRGRFTEPTSPAAMAPTLARLLAVDPPSSCVVEPLDSAIASGP